jgi:hypothetical protein
VESNLIYEPLSNYRSMLFWSGETLGLYVRDQIGNPVYRHTAMFYMPELDQKEGDEDTIILDDIPVGYTVLGSGEIRLCQFEYSQTCLAFLTSRQQALDSLTISVTDDTFKTYNWKAH